MSNNVIHIGTESDQTILLRQLLEESKRGEISGLLVIREYESGAIVHDIVGATSADERSAYHWAGIMHAYGRYFEDIDTEAHEYV